MLGMMGKTYLLVSVVTIALQPGLIARVEAHALAAASEGIVTKLTLVDFLQLVFLSALIFIGFLRLGLVQLLLKCLQVERSLFG